jgi:2-iminobutanoate/2-iminopropanoate deaminase
MNDPLIVSVPELPPTNSTYSQAVRLGGVVYVSGQLGVDPATGALVPGGAVAQYRQALTNVARILAAAGTSMKRVVKTTVYMTDFDELVELNRVYAEFFPDSPPAKTGVEVKRLALGGLIEIEVIAAAAD